MCIFDNPPSFCDQTCGHLGFPSPDLLLSSLDSLPPLSTVCLTPGQEIGEGKLYERDTLLQLLSSTAGEAVDLAMSEPVPEELEESAEMQDLVLTDRPSPGTLTARELAAHLYPSGKEPRYCLTIKSPSKNAMVRQSTVQYLPPRVKVGVLDHNQKSVKLNCRLFLKIRLFYSTAPVKEVVNSEG